MVTISASVGVDGENKDADVRIVQELLNNVLHLLLPSPPLTANGNMDSVTTDRIKIFQRRVVLLNPPDGRVDPSGKTLLKLNENSKPNFQARIPLFPLKQRPTLPYKEPGAGGRQFGFNRDGGNRLHAACDLIDEVGAEVLAMEDGTVLDIYDFFAGTVAIEVDHTAYVTRYGELSRPTGGLLKGMRVKRGDVIGFVGRLSTSGNSMLHLEMYSGTKAGLLTVRENPPLQRRSDLLDPTEFLDIASFDSQPLPLVSGRRAARVSRRVRTTVALRSDAKTTSDTLLDLAPDTSLVIIRQLAGGTYEADGTQRDDWYQVEVSNQTGFVAAFYVDQGQEVGRVSDRVDSFLSLRDEPSISAALLERLPSGSPLTVLEALTASSYTTDVGDRNDWLKVMFNGIQGYVAAFYVDLGSLGELPGGADANTILFTYVPKGASDRTASQDNLPAIGIRGVQASEKMAETDRNRVMVHKGKLVNAAREFNLPPALLAAIVSRESRGGNALASDGTGDAGNGFGLMQVDRRSHRVVTTGGPAGQAHINQATGILRDKVNACERDFPSLSSSGQLQTAVSRYNGGRGFAAPNSDQGTTGGDYMNDVWARAMYYARVESWA